jgi:hypothetical protein
MLRRRRWGCPSALRLAADLLPLRPSSYRLSRQQSLRRVYPGVFTIAVVFTLGLTATAATATQSATPVRIPLHIDYALLTQTLRQSLYGQGGRAQLWNGNNDCQYLYAVNPSFGQQNGVVQIEMEGYLNLGVPVDDRCLSPLTWSGIIAADTVPYIDGFALKLRVTDINLYRLNHQKSLFVGRGFDLIKGSVVPALQTYSYDLTPAIRELEGLARMAVAPADESAVQSALSTLRLEPQINSNQSGLQLMLVLDLVPSAPSPPIAASAAPLTPAEIAAWNGTLDNWDAFLVFAIKQFGASVSDAKVRSELLNILLDSRQRLVSALDQPQRSGPDPIRLLFLDEWSRLRQLIEDAAAQGRLGNRSLQFLSFISAGDALFALDQAASTLGIRISANDLRRLARIMAPQATGDPLAYNFDEDPQLRRIFGLPTPLQLPGVLEVPPTSALSVGPAGSGALPTGGEAPPSAGASPSGASIGPRPAIPAIRPSPLDSPSPTGSISIWSSGLSLLAPWVADAAERPQATSVNILQIVTLGRKLRAVVVNRLNASSYRNDIGQLLEITALYQLEDDPAGVPVGRLWPVLVKATAWQESCWRQFVMKRQRVWYLESRTGDIGLMQVNKYVWRGFYNLQRLRWDIVYNLSAGAEILQRLSAESSNHLNSNDPVVLARAAYAAYNGGPAAYNRWRQPQEPLELRTIDQSFWSKYRAVAAGRPFDILTCASHWGR